MGSIAGLLLVDKPAGMTSFDVVRRVRKVAKTRKVGHTGTLDPDATGLLPVALGGCTKLTKYLLMDEKRYAFSVRFGAATTTDDSTGEVLREAPWEHLTEALVRSALERFVGDIEQVPPVYSAIKVQGKRAHALARAGEDVELKARTITIHELEVEGFRWPEMDGVMRCGSGTYVRSLARDLGEALDSAAHTTRIRRLSVGPFSLAEAVPLEDLTEENLVTALVPPLEMVRSVGALEVSDEEAQALRLGQPIEARGETDVGVMRAAHLGTDLVAMVELRDKGERLGFWPRRVLVD